MKHELVYW